MPEDIGQGAAKDVPEPDAKPDAKDYAVEMANYVENYLGNPLVRRMFRFCTKRCKCGRRAEIAVESYIGMKRKKCLGCRMASWMTKRAIDAIIAKAAKNAPVEKSDIRQALSDSVWRRGLASVLEGIAKYGPQKPFTAYSPFLVVWNITRKCNLACIHCYEDAHTPAPDELTTQQALEAVDRMADAGVAYLAISGGEPLSRPDFFEIAKHIIDSGMGYSIATNGTLLTPESVAELKETKCTYAQVSLDGATAYTHNAFRGRNSFELTIEGIKRLAAAGIPIGIAMTVTRHNFKEVPAVIELTEKLGANIFMHYNFIPTGRGKGIISQDITPEERERLLTYLASNIGKKKCNLLSTAPQYARICAAKDCPITMTHFDTFSQEDKSGSISFLADFIGGCGTARLYCALEPNGDIEPCVFIPIVCGNILKDSLIEVWQEHPSMKQIRDRENFKGACKVCSHRNICGGCRARAYGYFKDLSESDPGCILAKEAWERAQKISNGEPEKTSFEQKWGM